MELGDPKRVLDKAEWSPSGRNILLFTSLQCEKKVSC